MKKFIIFLGIASLLSGCFHSNGAKSETKKIEGFHMYEHEEFTVLIPDEWEILTSVNFKSDTPKNTKIAFRSNLRNPRFTPNGVVIKNELSQEISSLDYAKTLHKKMSDDLNAYKEIQLEKKKIKISGKEFETLFVLAEGKESPDSDIKRFVQISGVKGKKAFIAIGSFLETENEGITKKMETMVKSLEIK